MTSYGVLGPLLVTQGGREIAVSSGKQRSILSVLLLRANGVVLAGQLIDEVWGTRAPPSARELVATYVWRLRRLLGDDIRGEPGGYRLRVGDDGLDLMQFHRLAALGQAQLSSGDNLTASVTLRAALDLWRGEPLANVTLCGGLSHELSALEDERFAVLELRIAADLGCGRHSLVTGELRLLTEHHPARERFACQLMLALHRSGRRGDALAVYQRARVHLSRELGVDPGEEMRALHQAVLRADPGLLIPAARPAGHPAAIIRPDQLPCADGGFRGRGAELARLDSLLAAHRTGSHLSPLIVTLSADPGVGKTSLAVQWALRVRPEFPDGQLFASLGGYRRFASTTPLAVLRRFMRSLGMPADQIPADLDEAAAQYRTVLSDRRILIVLDDVADSGTVLPVLPGTASCTVVVTSRDALTDLTASHGAVHIALRPLTAAESRMLLTASLATPGRLAGEPATDELAALCGHVPLALRLAAAQLDENPVLTVRDYVSQVTSRHRIAGQEAARQGIARSCHELSDRDLHAFTLLALMDTPRVSTPAAAAALGLPVAPSGQILRRLAKHRLLEDDGAGQYGMHDLVRGYAGERARAIHDTATRNAAITRWLEWCLAAVSLADTVIDAYRYRVPLSSEPPAEPPAAFGNRQDALAWLDAERPNLAAAVFQAAERDPALAWRIAWAMFGYFQLRKPWAEWTDTYRTGLSCAIAVSDPQGEAVMCYGLGTVYYYPRRFTEALDSYHRALSLFREAGDSRGEGIILNAIGNVYLETRRLDKALRFYDRALTIHRRGGHIRDEGVILNNLGEAYLTLGQYAQAERCARLGLDIQREMGNQRVEVFTLCHLGNARWRLGRKQDAVSLLHEALVLGDEIGDQHAVAWASHYLGTVLGESGAQEEACQHLRRAVDLFTSMGDPAAADVRAILANLTRGKAATSLPRQPDDWSS